MGRMERLNRTFTTGVVGARLALSLFVALGMVMCLAASALAALNPSTVTVGSQSEVLYNGTPGFATYVVNVTANGNGSTNMDIVVSGLPAGAIASPASTTLTSSPATFTLTINTTAATPTGTSTFTVTVRRAGNNNEASGNGTLTIAAETIPPSLTLSTLSDGSVTNNPVLNITGMAADASGIGSIAVNGSAISHDNGEFNTAIHLIDGENSITVAAYDMAGNKSLITRSITLDFEAPALTVAAPADGSTSVGRLIDITGTVETGCLVDVAVNGGLPQSANINGNAYTATVNLSTGMNTIEIIATDFASGQNALKRTVVSSAQGVTLQIVEPKEDVIVLGIGNTIKGTVADADGDVSIVIDVDGQTYIPAVVNGSFQQVVTLPSDEATYAVTVAATDDSNNTTIVQRNLILTARATLSASVPSPQVLGSPVLFTAGVPDGSGNYEYQFVYRLIEGNEYTVVRDYDASNTFEWNTGNVPPGAYYMIVYVRMADSSKEYVAKGYMSYGIVASPPATGLTLYASVPSPKVAGTIVKFTAEGIGGSGDYEYQFIQNSGNSSSVVKDYSESNEFEWNTTGLVAGTYVHQVFVRNVGSTLPFEARKSISYSIVAENPATGATLTFMTPTPQIAGTTVFFEAGGVGGSGSYEYKLLVKLGNVWTVIRDYSPVNVIEWNTSGLSAGTYSFQLFVRNEGSTAPFEAIKVAGYSLLADPPATGATLSTDVPSPQLAGTLIPFIAGGEGGSGHYEYKFMVKLGTAWVLVRDYSPMPEIEWNTEGLMAGKYSLQILVRNEGSPLSYEAYKHYTYVISAP